MLPDGSIEATDIWKRFRADLRRRYIRDQVERLRDRVTGQAPRGWRWALQDVTLHVEPGDAVGLIGPNGSGKSTLLKILTRVMYPYAGRVEVAGRVGALIEVRAGIHPELSGRENVFLYGALLGLSRKAITDRFDQIVDFAELDDAIDRQVKFYSSGMQMRLGFSVAAFLEPDILLVDEVLSVGDASFQQKCLDRMRYVLSQGTTLVFVSHDLAAVEAMCTKGMWLDLGCVKVQGTIREVLAGYRQSIEASAESLNRVDGLVRVMKVETAAGDNGDIAQTQGPLDVRLRLETDERRTAKILLGISQGPATPIFFLRRDVGLEPGENELRCSIARLPLPRGRYFVWLGVIGQRKQELLAWHPAARFDVQGADLDRPPPGLVRLAPVHVEATWEGG